MLGMKLGMADTSNKAIGERLVAVREARGFLQAFLANMIGTSQQRWSNYERDGRVPPPDLLLKFCQVTGATSDFILFGRLDGMPVELVKQLQALEAGHKEKAGPGARAG